jgi:RNA polymerase sigma-70 factor, ECF subfamily
MNCIPDYWDLLTERIRSMVKHQLRDDKQTEESLVEAAKHGKNEAFDQLVRRYQERILSVAQRITKNREDAEDVMQESFQQAFLHLHEFQGKSRFSTWLTRIAINESFMFIRKSKTGVEGRTTRAENGLDLVAETVADRSPNPETQCARRERAAIVRKAVNRLNEPIRNTILLRVFEERSIQETATILDASVSAVKGRAFLAQRTLRKYLAAVA